MAATTSRVTGEALASPEIVAARSAETPAATATLARYEERMARALAAVLNVLDPDVVVLGGGMSQIARLYERVPRLWQAWAFSDRVDTVLRAPCTATRAGSAGRPGSGTGRGLGCPAAISTPRHRPHDRAALPAGRGPLPRLGPLAGLPRARPRSPTAPPRRAPGSDADPPPARGTWLLVCSSSPAWSSPFAALRAPVEPLTLGELVQAIESG